jgi:hypothetical protein
MTVPSGGGAHRGEGALAVYAGSAAAPVLGQKNSVEPEKLLTAARYNSSCLLGNGNRICLMARIWRILLGEQRDLGFLTVSV